MVGTQECTQGVPELLGLGGRERTEEDPLSLPGSLECLAKDVPADFGKLDDVPAAVTGILTAAHQVPFLKLVDQRDHRGAVDPHPAGDLTLGQRMRAIGGPQHRHLPAGDPEGLERASGQLGEPQLHVLEQVPEVIGHLR